MQAKQAPTLPPPSTPPQAVEATQSSDPSAVYAALSAQLNVFRNQVSDLESRRLSIAQRLRAGGANGADRAGLEERLQALDKQIVAGYDQLASAQAALAKAAAVPGSVPPVPQYPRSQKDDGAMIVGSLFMLCFMLPLAIALARRIARRGQAAVIGLPKELVERLNRIEESVEAVAIEVERVGEGQRFVTNLFVEGGTPNMLGAGAAEPIEVKQRERVEQERRA